MPQIPRKTAKIFGGSLSASNNVAKFGSLAVGSPAFSLDLDDIQTAEWLLGWAAAVVGNNSPALEDFNGVFLALTQQIAYALQSGVPEYDAGTTYFEFGICRKDGVTYVSLVDDNVGNDPATPSASWVSLEAPAGGGTNSQSIAVDAAAHLLAQTELFDPDGCFAASIYTAKTAGIYRVSAFVQVDNDTGVAATMELSLSVVKNGAVTIFASGANVPSPSGGRWYPKVMGTIQLAAGDTVGIYLTANDGTNAGAVDASNGNFSIERVRAI